MNWRHRIAVVLLSVFAGLPVSGTLCALACESASSAVSAHHGSDQNCENPRPPSSDPQVNASSEHDCSTHGVVRQATTPAGRADLAAKSPPLMVGAVQIESVLMRDSLPFLESGAPPGTAPPTTTPLVLRI